MVSIIKLTWLLSAALNSHDKCVAVGQVSGANGHAYRRGEQPRLANKIIDKNKINNESRNNRIANDGGVGSTALLDKNIPNNYEN